MTSVPRTPSHFRRRVAAVLASTLAAGGLAVAAAPTASAVSPADHSHDPVGKVTSTKAVSGGIQFTGWAYDPDARTSKAEVAGLVDGRRRGAAATTSLTNAAVRTKYHTGATPGFTITVPVDTTAPHTVCLIASNTGLGYRTALKCVVTPLGTKLSAAQRSGHNPAGRITSFAVSSTAMRVRGYATDPDWITRKLIVVLYVNGRSTATVMTRTYQNVFSGTRPAGVGKLSAFDVTVPVSSGSHLGCVWVVNVGIGNGNAFLGCQAGDTRGRAGSGTVATPALNKKVVAEAKKHIGQPYVWGATGPKKFDCSGLVMYSYGKFGYTTPRVSEDQFLAARMIPAERAVPGDLVFYHDSVGDVYHVGIYLSPGRTVAAIDEAEGVNYQTIWDASTATYGSFTHS